MLPSNAMFWVMHELSETTMETGTSELDTWSAINGAMHAAPRRKALAIRLEIFRNERYQFDLEVDSGLLVAEASL